MVKDGRSRSIVFPLGALLRPYTPSVSRSLCSIYLLSLWANENGRASKGVGLPAVEMFAAASPFSMKDTNTDTSFECINT